MDRRGWPWKKKSEKAAVLAHSASASNSIELQIEKDDVENEKYIQIKMETYMHFTGLEDQVKNLTEKLLLMESEITAKGSLVKQHTKVAEEAVSGWEKAEAEASSLKQQLESVTLLKLAAEERALHLDNALKECMKQIRNVKDDSEQKLYEVIFARTTQWEKVKAELEGRINIFEQELQNASAENSALARSLQERSSSLKKLSDEKSHADAEIELLKKDLHSYEQEINSMKYELNVVVKEVEIRNEEKNMCMRSAEIANKHHQEDVKKITKLEAECQRLRGLVRKRLPGPAALAQMKLEVENLGRESGESRLRRSSLKGSTPHHLLPSDNAFEHMEQVHKENEFLTARLLTMEEDMKLLKEALSKGSSELLASRNLCAKQANKLCSMKANVLFLKQQESSLKSTIEFGVGKDCNPPSWTSLSEDGLDEEGSFSESCPTALVSDNLHSKKGRDFERVNTTENSDYLKLMDDFLEMERLACLSTKENGDINKSENLESDKMDNTSLSHCESKGYGYSEKCADSELSDLTVWRISYEKDLPLFVLKSRITSIFESKVHGPTAKKIIDDIRHIILDSEELLKEETESMNELAEQKHFHEYTHENTDDGMSPKQCGILCTKGICLFDQELKDALSHIHEFVLSLGKDVAGIQGSSNEWSRMVKIIEGFCAASVGSMICNKVCLHSFILALSRLLCKTSVCRFKDNEGENYGSDCIDKETLLENRVTQLEESISGASSLVAHNSSSPEFEGSIDSELQIKSNLPMLSLEDFNQLKLEKEKIEADLIRCQEMLCQSNFTLTETEQQLSEVKSELTSCQKSNSLAETQLKCMVESYKILESQKEELEVEISRLHEKAVTLDNELQDERDSHQESVVKYKELQEQIERNMKSSAPTFPSSTSEVNTLQEMGIAAAAEKLAECQETIFLLCKQLQAMRNPAEPADPSPNRRSRLDETMVEETDAGCPNSRQTISTLQADGGSPIYRYNFPSVPSDSESAPSRKSPVSTKYQKQRDHRSSSSSSSSEKQGRGFTRFFSVGKMEK